MRTESGRGDWRPGRSLAFALVLLAPHPSLRIPRPALQNPPPAPPPAWQAIIGEYGRGGTTHLLVLERAGALFVQIDSVREVRLIQSGPNRFQLADSSGHPGTVVFDRGTGTGRVVRAVLGSTAWPRRSLGPDEGNVFRIRPARPLGVLRREALAATPPAESGDFRASDLVELRRLDPTIKLDIRYASTRNFLGTPVYSQARAFLQRPAAEALVRAHRALKAQGYGLLIHDGYRPWYVTRIFWDATPPAQHEFVADPAEGSRHNRGCAVDLTLFELRSGRAVEMPGVYDEMSQRSYPGYPGGSSRQRWLRDLLRRAMEAEGFTVNSSEWWHFDHQDWRSYRIGNQRFEELRARSARPSTTTASPAASAAATPP